MKEAGVAYEYLDGSTKDRAERVDRFQKDPTCRSSSSASRPAAAA